MPLPYKKPTSEENKEEHCNVRENYFKKGAPGKNALKKVSMKKQR
jgi:hypothetical protein